MSCWKDWRIFFFFIMIFATIVWKLHSSWLWITESAEQLEKEIGMTSQWCIIEGCWFVAKTGIYIYLCFVFKSLEMFLKALNYSDDFDGEHVDNVSQSKSEKERIEILKKKSEEKQENIKKKEKADIDNLIVLRLEKFKDFSKLQKRPKTLKGSSSKSEGNLSSDNYLYIYNLFY